MFTWGMTLPRSWRSMVGRGGRKGRTEMGAEAKHMSQCLHFQHVKRICQAILIPEYIMTK